MVEYASVRSSLYDIDALVNQLNERADEGWEVVQILPTGGDVTAVLRRSPQAEAPADDEGTAAPPVTLYDTGEYEVVTAEAEETVDADGDGVADEVVEAVVVEELVDDDVPEAVAASVDEAAAEPPGWAVAPVAAEEVDTADDAAADAPSDTAEVAEIAAVTAVVAEPDEPAAAAEPATEAVPVAAAAAAEQAPAAESTPAPAPPPAPAPAAPSIPAGWYPDPSGRFELRYWDGSAWTEHVARGGQMYTDPPVA